MNNNEIEVFFHIGIERTATTYMQNKIFPCFKNICYIHKKDYKRAAEIINKKKYQKYLISYELNMNEQFEREIKSFSQKFPNTKIIIVLRQQHEWLKSQYKRYIKNGRSILFHDFVDVENNQGIYKKEDLFFYNRLKQLEQCFYHKPKVLFYKNFKENPLVFIKDMALYIGATFNEKELSKKPIHKSYSEKQLLALIWVMKYINLNKTRGNQNSKSHFLRKIIKDVVRYSVLYVMLLLPISLLKNQALFPTKYIDQIKRYYEKDWTECLEY